MDPYLYCTDEPNDVDLVRELGPAAIALPIASGDVCFSGIGDNKDSQILVCCERKKVGDLASCIQTGRYLHQLQIAKGNGVDVFCLILEGRYRRGPEDGLLEVPVWGVNPRTLRRAELWQPVKPSIQFSRFDDYLTELSWFAGIIVKHTETVRGTADVIQALYSLFQRPSSGHNSLKQIYKSPLPSVQLVAPSLVRRIAAELPGIGWERSKAVAEGFPTVKDMVLANANQWSSIDGIGRKTAGKIVKALGG